MKSATKRVVVGVVIIALFAVATVHMPSVYSAELTADDKLVEFLSSVVGLDLTKYTLISPTPPPDRAKYTYPPEFFGLVKEECPSFKFEADGNTIRVMSIFHNEQMVFFSVSAQDPSAYSEALPDDILNQAKTILQRYQAFTTQVYATDSSYLVSMQNILNRVNDLSPANITDGNVNLQVSTNGDYTRIQWIYTENGVSMKYKTVDLSFYKNNFASFVDTWDFYSIGGFSVIDSEEAYKMALEAAQNCELRIGYENGTTKLATLPDLSDAFYQMYFNMLPYRNETSHIPSKIARDPSTLYPYWQFYFYFNETIAGNSGIQVGIWGDTEEIIYCSGFGYYGTSDPNGTTAQNNNSATSVDINTVSIVAVSTAVVVIAASILFIKKRSK